MHLAGADPTDGLGEFPADARAVRGFNGDIAEHLHRWRSALACDTEVARLDTPPGDREAIAAVLEGPGAAIVRAFASEIGLWTTP